MPGRGQSEGSVYQVGAGPDAGKWVAALVTGWKPSGQPMRKVRKRSTQAAAKKALRDLLNDRDRGRLPSSPQAWTLAAWLEHWLEVWSTAGDPPADSTYHGYAAAIRTHVVPTIGATRLDQFREQHYRKVMRRMDVLGRAASTRRQVYVVLNQAMKEAVRAGVLPYNPLEQVSPPPVARRELDVPAKEDVVSICDAVAGAADEARWLIALDLGLRQGEALGLRVEQVDLDRRTITITHQLRRLRGVHACGEPRTTTSSDGKPRREWPCGHGWASKCPGGTGGRLALVRVKSRKGQRTVPITDELRPLLAEQVKRRDRERRMHGTRYVGWRPQVDGRERDVVLLFAQPNGRPIEPRDDWAAWQAILGRAGLSAHRLHAARHAAVVNMIDSGVPIKWVSELIGHSSTAFTQDTYGHFSDDAAVAARDRISAGRRRAREAVKDRRRGHLDVAP